VSAYYRKLADANPDKTFQIQMEVNPSDNSVSLPFVGTSSEQFTVFWDDTGNVNDTYTHTGSTVNATHTYSSSANVTIRVQGSMGKYDFGSLSTTEEERIKTIDRWGNVSYIADQSRAFLSNVSQDTNTMAINALDYPKLPANSNCALMFFGMRNDSPNAETNGKSAFEQRSFASKGLSGLSWATDATSNIINLESTFESAFERSTSGTSGDFTTATLNGWDTSNVTNMKRTFASSYYLGSLSNWNTGNVTTMEECFAGNGEPGAIVSHQGTFENYSGRPVNPDIGEWDTSSVTNMKGIFDGAECGLANCSQWNTINVTTLEDSFRGAQNLGSNPQNWNTSNVTNMANTFGVRYAGIGSVLPYNSVLDLGSFDTSKVTSMEGFMNSYGHDLQRSPNIDGLNVGNVTTMHKAFGGNLLISGIDPSLDVISNANIVMDPSGWNTSSLSVASNTFIRNKGFNSNIGGWNLSSITTMANMLDDSAISTENYSKTLIGWANFVSNAGGSPASITLGAANVTYNNTTYTGSPYSDAVAARAYLVSSGGSNPGWTITDGGQA